MKREAKRTRPRKEENPIFLPLAETKRVKLGERCKEHENEIYNIDGEREIKRNKVNNLIKMNINKLIKWDYYECKIWIWNI